MTVGVSHCGRDLPSTGGGYRSQGLARQGLRQEAGKEAGRRSCRVLPEVLWQGPACSLG